MYALKVVVKNKGFRYSLLSVFSILVLSFNNCNTFIVIKVISKKDNSLLMIAIYVIIHRKIEGKMFSHH